MRLSQFTVRRFKSIKEITITVPKTDAERPGSADFVSIVGENNLGKSSVLEALLLVCPGTSISSPDEHHFPKRDVTAGPIEVELIFDDVTAADQQKQAIHPTYIVDGTYRVRKTWSGPNEKPQIQVYCPEYQFPDFPEKKKKEAGIRAASPDYSDLFDQWVAAHGAPDSYDANFYAEFKRFAIQKASPVAKPVGHAWANNPGGIAANLDSVLPEVIFVPAIKETNKEAAVTQGKSTIRKLVDAMFEDELQNHYSVRAFTNAADNIKKLFADGAKNKVITNIEVSLTAKLARLINIKAELDFVPPDVSSDLAGKTELWIRDEGVRVHPQHQGHGAQRSLILALLEEYAERHRGKEAADYKRPRLFLVEEPEIYLHPQMCRRMRDVLVSIARSGTAQVVCTTHSPIFLDLADRHDGIVLFRRVGNELIVKQRTDDLFQGKNDSDLRRRLRMILDFDPTANEVFFARVVRLVEGDTETAALDAIGEKLIEIGKATSATWQMARRSVCVVKCRGKWTIVAFQRVLNAFGVEYRVVHDKDDDAMDAGANASILEQLEGDESKRRVHAPDFEGDLFKKKWTKDKPWRALKEVNAANTIDGKLAAYAEFMLGRTLASLAAAPAAPAVAAAVHDGGVNLVCRDDRDALPRISSKKLSAVAGVNGCDMVGIAAGRACLPDVHFQRDVVKHAEAANLLCAHIVGDSMERTLRDADRILLRPLPAAVTIESVEDDELGFAAGQAQLQSDKIYVLAMNDDIDSGYFTIKRVMIDALQNGRQLVRITADNPLANWGYRGEVLVRPRDRVRVIAEFVALVEDGG